MKYLIILLPAFIFFGCGESDRESISKATNGKKAIPVRVVKVQKENIVLSIQASGVVASDNESKPAFKIGGVVAEMFVEEGAFVKKGQLLASLNQTEISAQVNQANEAVAKAERDLQRAQNLYADSVATLENVQDAQTGLNVATQNLKMANFNQDFSEIRSPISGKVVKKLVNPGEIVGPGMPAYFILGNTSSDWVIKAGLADRDWARVAIGDRALVRLDAYPGIAFDAKVSDLSDTGNPGSGTFDVELTLTGQPPRLAAGLIASVEIFPKQDGDQMVIPLDALVETKGSEAIIFTLKNKKAIEVPVKIAFLYKDKVVIQSGLEGIDMVVTDGAPYLYNGAEVEVVE